MPGRAPAFPWMTGRRNRRRAARAAAAGVLFLSAALVPAGTAAMARAGEARAAVAANFSLAARDIGAAFERATGHKAVFSFGATGQLFAQIAQAAPHEVFLAADRERPRKAVEDGYAVPGTRFTYAVGRLALYSREPGLRLGAATLRDRSFDRLAIANPATAPYGAAAVQALRALGVHERLAPRLVRGIDVGQAFRFVATGNAEFGLVALSQVGRGVAGSHWVVPAGLHAAIAQDAVLLRQGLGDGAARAFLDFLRGPEARAIKEAHGYGAGD